MTDLSQDTAKQIAQAMQQTENPSNARKNRVTEATRVPMSSPNAKLAVPAIPGYYCYWHLGKNVAAALKAGYTFVEEDEVDLEQSGVANDPSVSGNSDMGTRVSAIANKSLDNERLYLMKLPDAWRKRDEEAQAEVNESVARALRAGTIGAERDPDANLRYMKQGQDLFYPRDKKLRK